MGEILRRSLQFIPEFRRILTTNQRQITFKHFPNLISPLHPFAAQKPDHCDPRNHGLFTFTTISRKPQKELFFQKVSLKN